MLIVIFPYKITETKAFVQGIHYDPFHPTDGFGKTQEELEAEGGIFVERNAIPEPENNGMAPRLYINPQTKELWYEYEEIPKTPEQLLLERVASLEKIQREQEQMLLTLIYG